MKKKECEKMVIETLAKKIAEQVVESLGNNVAPKKSLKSMILFGRTAKVVRNMRLQQPVTTG